jgi:PPOX class probable F420-dependent enzyme
MAATELNDAAKAMLKEPIVGTLMTTNADGTPHMVPVWIDGDGDDVVVNTMSKRQKAVNARRGGPVGVCLIDPANPFRVLSLSGRVTEVTEEGAQEHIDALTMRYMGLDKHPFDHPDEGVRVMLRIQPDRVLIQPS